MPASRSARAMIFAPRSWPSRPGLAITTRIFRAIAGSLDLDGSGYVQCRQVRLTHLAAGTSFDPPADPLVEALARLVIERTMTGIGVEHRDVLLRGVDHVPDVTADADVAEAVARFDLRAESGYVVGGRRRPLVGLRRGAERDVIVLHIDEEVVAVLRQHVVRGDHGERAAVAEEPGRLLVAQLGIDPVEGGEGDDRVEVRVVRLPRLVGGVDDPDRWSAGPGRTLPQRRRTSSAGDLGGRWRPRCGRATSQRARPRRFSAPTRPRANGRRASRGRA